METGPVNDRNACRPYAARAMRRLGARRESGQGLVEYAIILVMVAVVVAVILITTGGTIKNMFSNVACSMAWGQGSCTVQEGG